MTLRSAHIAPVLLALVTAGCAHSKRASEQPEPTEPMTADVSQETAEEPEELVVDADTEVIDFGGDEEDAGPAPMVVAPPKRPNMPSMMPGVVTGPTGQAPGG